MPFLDTVFKSIDLQRAVTDQYGPTARLELRGQHLWDWKAVRDGQDLNIDLQKAADVQLGPGHIVTSVGVHAYDWKALAVADLRDRVLPVMFVSSNLFFSIEPVRAAVASFRRALEATQTFYNNQLGRTFELIPPLAVYSVYTGAQWDDLARQTGDPATRGIFYHRGVDEYWRNKLPNPGGTFKVVMAPYTALTANAGAGAAAAYDHAMAPASVTTVTGTDYTTSAAVAEAVYAIGHELGHTLGLNHPCPDPANGYTTPFPPPPSSFPPGDCGLSIMQNPGPGSYPGRFHQYEKDWLLANARVLNRGGFTTAAAAASTSGQSSLCVITPQGP
jgi:hypothetical protein